LKLSHLILAITVVAVPVAFFAYARPSVITVIADGDLNLYDRATSDPDARRVVVTTKAGEEAIVISCIDLKHYLVPEVALADGRKVYVIDGPFQIRRESPWPYIGRRPIVWGC
jgi:hypothetical protein